MSHFNLQCIYCGTEVTRTIPVLKASCFDCRQLNKQLRLNGVRPKAMNKKDFNYNSKKYIAQLKKDRVKARKLLFNIDESKPIKVIKKEIKDKEKDKEFKRTHTRITKYVTYYTDHNIYIKDIYLKRLYEEM